MFDIPSQVNAYSVFPTIITHFSPIKIFILVCKSIQCGQYGFQINYHIHISLVKLLHPIF